MKKENQTLDELLKKHNISKINNSVELKNHFNLDLLDEDSVPAVITKEKTIIIIDNEDFNETYLIDIVNECFDLFLSGDRGKDIKLLYIDNFDLRCLIFNIVPDIRKLKTIEERKAFEKVNLVPSFIIINPNREDMQINLIREKFIPFDETMFKNIINASQILK